MEVFAVLICCAIAAALGFFIGAVMRTSPMVTLSIENRKLRERIKSEVQESTVRGGCEGDETGIFEKAKKIVETTSFETARDEVMIHLPRFTPFHRELTLSLIHI